MASEAAVSSPAPQPPALQSPVPLPPVMQVAPSPVAPLQPAVAPPARADKTNAVTTKDGPHIALLLPLGSKDFGRHADAVRNGFLAAGNVQATALPIRIYSVDDDLNQTVETYIKALGNGARLVVGPLTRDGVTAIINSATVLVPTLVLNSPEGHSAIPPEIYMLNLQIEAEARQVAQLAWQDGMRKAITVIGDTPLLKRIHQAFVEEFTRLGGSHVIGYSFNRDPENLNLIKKAVDTGTVDMAFLALDVPRARLARPYLGAIPIYATSQVFPGNAGPLASFDLAGVRFLDMPWLLQPDHPAVMIYARPDIGESIEIGRFYALGIDAYRISQLLISGRADTPLDGVTGRLTLGQDHRYLRGLTAALFIDGKITVPMRETP